MRLPIDLRIASGDGARPTSVGLAMCLSVCLLGLAAGCGKEIGDSCVLSTDCDPNGARVCDLSATDGYCTIMGCDYDTCPSEAECVAFFMGEFDNETCNAATEDQPGGTNDCNPDEACTLDGHCAPIASEVRYCMRTCTSGGDCRDGYECRDLNLMKEHGGQPILAPGDTVDDSTPKFCGAAPGS
ncbi:MAG TPA: hypothetical protein VH914_17190 [Acidimicrobiia bacterium]|jgi:hypothetical protein|nr:hypothetical protein [Acidimicrobiia bacterium]